MNPWITPQQAARAVRRVNAEGSVFREYSDEQLLEIFTVYEQWKNRETSRSINVNDVLRRFHSVIERLRSCDLRRRQDLLNRFLDREKGLHSIADADDIVWWVKLDLLELLMRWRRGDLDPFLLRGIEIRKSQSTGSVSRGEDRSYRFKRAANVQGHNGLQVGQWWPLRIAMLRDGAHGSSEAGIAGNESLGAISCILGGGAIGTTGRDYPDVDNGETVLYCSTTNQSRTMTTNTKLMLTAYRNSNPIRLFRGSRLNSRYAPEEGIRYDGLYKIQNFEELNRETKLYHYQASLPYVIRDFSNDRRDGNWCNGNFALPLKAEQF
ncbi:hypothetical protein KEM56_002496 [Ascosphaera pollenicola]|nr:hypothetical protein KEM56_002496 [Ascosphaera pollenicola]